MREKLLPSLSHTHKYTKKTPTTQKTHNKQTKLNKNENNKTHPPLHFLKI